jgi:Fic family protein
VPPPLPPDPPLALQSLLPLLEQANQALGRLDGLASILPDPSLFIYLYVRKEAVLSSQIEDTQSSFSDLMLFESAEAPSVPLEDIQEVSNYVAAINHGFAGSGGLPAPSEVDTRNSQDSLVPGTRKSEAIDNESVAGYV